MKKLTCTQIHYTVWRGNWSDVFASGVLLVMLISGIYSAEDKMNHEIENVHDWAESEYDSSPTRSNKSDCVGFSLVKEELEKDKEYCPRDGHKITDLAMQFFFHGYIN